jgi:hypothetical protein
VLGEAQRRTSFLEGLVQHPPSADELNPTQVLGLQPEQVESVETGVGLTVAAEQPVEVRRPSRQCETASPSSMSRLNGSACMASVMATNSADQSRPLRDHSRTLSPSLWAMMR